MGKLGTAGSGSRTTSLLFADSTPVRLGIQLLLGTVVPSRGSHFSGTRPRRTLGAGIVGLLTTDVRPWGKNVISFPTTDIRAPITGIAPAGDLFILIRSTAPHAVLITQELAPSYHRWVVSGRKRLSNPCLLPPLGALLGVRFSHLSSDPSGPEKVQGGSGMGPSGSSALAEETVVPSSPVPLGRVSFPSPAEAGHGVPTSVKDSSSSSRGALSDLSPHPSFGFLFGHVG